MDGAWRRPPKSLADYGHIEPKRDAEWWGKSALLTFALSKVSRRQGGTLSGRYLNNGICTPPDMLVDCQAAFAGKPAPTFGSRGVR